MDRESPYSLQNSAPFEAHRYLGDGLVPRESVRQLLYCLLVQVVPTQVEAEERKPTGEERTGALLSSITTKREGKEEADLSLACVIDLAIRNYCALGVLRVHSCMVLR